MTSGPLVPPVTTDPATRRPGAQVGAERGGVPASAPGDAPAGGPPSGLPRSGAARRRGDQLFRTLSLSAGVFLLSIIVAIAVFLVVRAVPSLQANEGDFLTDTAWDPNATPPVFGIAALAFGTLLSSALALVLALPVALGVALFISHYAPRRMAGSLGFVVDLLAAVPSVVYGLWGISLLNAYVVDLSAFLAGNAGWFPLFGTTNGFFGRSVFLASIVLAVMILPIIASLSREVFLQVPTTNQEAALALGATRWEMIRTAVLPFGRPGVIGATMLGLGRALGETIAVALVLSPAYVISFDILEAGTGNTIAANIALQFGEANATGRSALIASGLVLFAITLVVNLIARSVIYRRREFTGGAL
ncbi:MAG: phosphate ABC transporter permease subunit PstC [Actinomycetota bacterium]|jgi:phosphate transport system permease protein|nr:phosphate ABC transporter permease subunit PstC [Actinomycetota bacterium]